MRIPFSPLRTLVLAALAVALLSAAPAGAVIGGQPDAAHPYVVAVASNETMLICSGSLISPTVVVTAAHCVGDGETGVLVSASPGMPWPPPQWPVTGTATVHPDYCVGCAPGLPGLFANDVAVVVLEESIVVDRYAELPTAGLSDTLGRSPLTIVGYGAAGFATGFGPPRAMLPFQRMAATVDLIPGQHSWRDQFLRISANQARICDGDSGGPNLLGDTIVAITSYGNRMCAGTSYSYRLDTPEALGFITPFLQQD